LLEKKWGKKAGSVGGHEGSYLAAFGLYKTALRRKRVNMSNRGFLEFGDKVSSLGVWGRRRKRGILLRKPP